TRVNRSSKQLLELIINVIDIAKIEGHRIEIFPAEFSSRSVVNEVMAEFKEAAEKKGISLQLKGEEDIYLYSDRKRFAQCVHNLVSNAVKYTEKGGVEIVQLKKGKNIELSVVDTGIGIAPDEISTCFQAFERLPTHLKVKAGGAGLGLYLTKKISTEVLHGGLTVESKVNKGSCFTITVPCELELES
ncbi:MAG: HAMP domain-containing histidine kinase, partial [Gammaproteobacteria bacterium]|nr:HAMP domain-containing histidine kinase [Gammaproteobacteria bacterium]